MGDVEKTLRVRQVGADEHAIETIQSTMPFEEAEEVVSDLISGDSMAFAVEDDDGNRQASFVVALEQVAGVTEMVIQAALGRAPGISLTKAVTPFIKAIAAVQGAQKLSLVTRREGFERVLLDEEFYRSADMPDGRMVFKWDVANGR